MSIIAPSDLPSSIQAHELIDTMVAGANAKALRVAPCLASDYDPAPSADLLAEAKLILVGSVKRWAEAGAGSVQQQSAGPFAMSVDTRQRTGFGLWPSEITALQDLCSSTSDSGAFSVDTVSQASVFHADACSVNFGAEYCSCGAILTGLYPLYEV